MSNNSGMTDKQFNSYIRLVLSSLKDVIKLLKTDNIKEAITKLQEITDILQQTIED